MVSIQLKFINFLISYKKYLQKNIYKLLFVQACEAYERLQQSYEFSRYSFELPLFSSRIYSPVIHKYCHLYGFP